MRSCPWRRHESLGGPVTRPPRVCSSGDWTASGARTTSIQLAAEVGDMRGFSITATGQVARSQSVTDGMSNTIIIGEVLPARTPTTRCRASPASAPARRYRSTSTPVALSGFGADRLPVPLQLSARGFKSLHPGGANLASSMARSTSSRRRSTRHLQRAGQPGRRRGHQLRLLLIWIARRSDRETSSPCGSIVSVSHRNLLSHSRARGVVPGAVFALPGGEE